MEKTKAVMKIESFSNKDGTLLLSVSDFGVRTLLQSLVDLCKQKHGGYVKLELSAPYPPRTTGVGSQNNKIWAMITQICNHTGYTLPDMEDYAKLRAVVRGYPYRENRITGEIKPYSMTEIDTVQAGLLIDELYQIAAESGTEIYESS